MSEHAATARRIIDANRYLTLATADADGRPWVTPVWFAPEGYTDFIWVSRPSTRHSTNIAVRPGVGIVVFDSTVAIGQGQAVYIEAVAEQIADTGSTPRSRSSRRGRRPTAAGRGGRQTLSGRPPSACTAHGRRRITSSTSTTADSG